MSVGAADFSLAFAFVVTDWARSITHSRKSGPLFGAPSRATTTPRPTPSTSPHANQRPSALKPLRVIFHFLLAWVWWRGHKRGEARTHRQQDGDSRSKLATSIAGSSTFLPRNFTVFCAVCTVSCVDSGSRFTSSVSRLTGRADLNQQDREGQKNQPQLQRDEHQQQVSQHAE